MTGISVSILRALIQVILATTLRGRHYYHPHLIDVCLFLDPLSIILHLPGILGRLTYVNGISSLWLLFWFY